MSDAVLDALWKAVTTNWDDDAVHASFLEHCRATGQLLQAAVRYRGMAGDHVRGPSAEKRLRAIAVLAVAALEVERAPARPRSASWGKVVLIVLFLSGSVALWTAWNG
jgi:hypothetical protein